MTAREIFRPRMTAWTPAVVAIAIATAPRGLLMLIPYAFQLVVWFAFYRGRRR